MAASNTIASILAKLSPEEVEAILTQSASKATAKAKADARKAQYGKSLVDLVTQVIESEEYAAPEGKDWAGYKVYGVPVVVEGHTFTVSVTVTDTDAKAAREAARKRAEAMAVLGLEELPGDSEEEDGDES